MQIAADGPRLLSVRFIVRQACIQGGWRSDHGKTDIRQRSVRSAEVPKTGVASGSTGQCQVHHRNVGKHRDGTRSRSCVVRWVLGGTEKLRGAGFTFRPESASTCFSSLAIRFSCSLVAWAGIMRCKHNDMLFDTRERCVELMRQATTSTGLKTTVNVIHRICKTGRNATESIKKAIRSTLDFHRILPKWNYTIKPENGR